MQIFWRGFIRNCRNLSEFIGNYPKLSAEKHRRYLLNAKEEAECPMTSNVIDIENRQRPSPKLDFLLDEFLPAAEDRRSDDDHMVLELLDAGELVVRHNTIVYLDLLYAFLIGFGLPVSQE